MTDGVVMVPCTLSFPLALGEHHTGCDNSACAVRAASTAQFLTLKINTTAYRRKHCPGVEAQAWKGRVVWGFLLLHGTGRIKTMHINHVHGAKFRCDFPELLQVLETAAEPRKEA